MTDSGPQKAHFIALPAAGSAVFGKTDGHAPIQGAERGRC